MSPGPAAPRHDRRPGTPNATICSYAQRVTYTATPDAAPQTLYHATFYVKDKTWWVV